MGRVDTRVMRFLLPAILFAVGRFVYLTISPRFTVAQAQAQQLPDRVHSIFSPRQLLIASYRSASDLTPTERAHVLEEDSASAVTIDPGFCRRWSEELFFFAAKLPPEWDRVAAEKNALVALSQVDADRAFELFKLIELPIPMPDGRLPEDVRADGATTVFAWYWKSHKSMKALQEISDQADGLGNTGQYPYTAMADIFEDIAGKYPLKAEEIVMRSLASYRRGSKSEREDDDFLGFLDTTWKDLTPSLRRAAIEAAVERLSEKSNSREGEIFSGSAVSRRAQTQFSTKAQMNLYNLLPRIQEIDPEWASEIVKRTRS